MISNNFPKLFLLLFLLAILNGCEESYAEENLTSAPIFPSINEFDGYMVANIPNNINLPADAGGHEDYQTEWWYYTGNLSTEDGQKFGYQFTLFRYSLAPESEMAESASIWRTNQLYFAHLAVADIDSSTFLADEKFSRDSIGLAGAKSEPYHIWIEDWVVQESDGMVHMIAKTEEFGVDLFIETNYDKAILHGEGGLSIKGSSEGEASYYYSLLGDTSGTIYFEEAEYEVTGRSWMDHEYFTNDLGRDATGWDWFSAQFDNGQALMYGQIRLADGGIRKESHGTLVASDFTTQHIQAQDIELSVLDTWTSPDTSIVYPIQWSIQSTKHDIDLVATVMMPNCELQLNLNTYFECPTAYEGTLEGNLVSGEGYMELTGYTP